MSILALFPLLLVLIGPSALAAEATPPATTPATEPTTAPTVSSDGTVPVIPQAAPVPPPKDLAPAAKTMQPAPVTAAPVPAPATPPPSAFSTVDFDRIEDQKIYFKTTDGSRPPKPFKTGLFDLKYLGPLRPAPSDGANVPPYFLFAGRSCKDCLQDPGLYALRADGGRTAAYIHPGKIFDRKSRALVLDSRAFYGRCLPRRSGGAFVVFSREHVDRRRGMQSSVFVAEPGEDHMEERLIERHLPRLQDTLRMVHAKTCHEVEGRSRLMLPRPLDIDTRNSSDDGDADDDEKDDKGDQQSP